MRVLARSATNSTTGSRGFSPDWDSETSQVVYQEVGRCYDPDKDWSTLPTADEAIPWEADFTAAVAASRNLGYDMPAAQVIWRPVTAAVNAFGSFAWYLPWHTAATLTSDREKTVKDDQSWPDSHCFEFDYSKEDAKDPHGCRFFKKSFQPLQELRQCVLGKLEDSNNWRTYQKMSKRVVSHRQQGERVDTWETASEEEKRLIEKLGISKFTFDGIRRVDEMIKYASYKNWEDMEDGLVDELEKKIAETIITKDKQTMLEKEIVASIRSECFHVKVDRWVELPEAAKRLKRIMPCYQLMWDQIEVAGGNEKPLSNAITMWDASLRFPTQIKRDTRSPAVCARAAVALIAEPLKRAPGRFSKKSCLLKGQKSWKKCLHPQHFNCICFTHCFQRALEKMCEFNKGCCDASLDEVAL